MIVNLDVFSGTDRLIFGGGTHYTTEEITGLQNFFKFLKGKNKRFSKEVYDEFIINQ